MLASDGDLMEGGSGEASSLAGHLGLGNLVVLYDDNRITIEGETSLAFTEDVCKRYDAYGWHTIVLRSSQASFIPAFEDIAERIAVDAQQAARREANEAYYEDLKARYSISFPEPASAAESAG